jgi:tRNA-specific 2-thiouridylase
VADERFADHLEYPRGLGPAPAGSHHGQAGGAACGDLVRLSVRVDGDRVAEATFDASGCGAAQAAASAAVELVTGAHVLDAARIGSPQIAAELGGLLPSKLHAADLASDALAWALGRAVSADGAVPLAEGRTLIAMSGGVDSAVAAIRVGGGDNVAVTLELWRDPENDGETSCCSAQAVRTARGLAHRMGLPHLTIDLREPFRAGVVQPWLDEHREGLTPNPCVRCNGHVRLDAMLDLADRVGAEALATGHYARRTPDGRLRLAADPAKDQAYMLCALGPKTLDRLRFPLGELTKPEVRALAAEAGLSVANKPDSQDLCFLAGTGRAAFLARHGNLRDRPGRIVDGGGHEVGRHRGAHHFTVGQRRGLAVGGTAEPLYVLATDTGANTVTVGPRAALDVGTVAVRGVRLHEDAAAVDAVKLRYRSAPVACRFEGETIVLRDPASAPAPGQTACLLRGDVVVGSATVALSVH